ncbi:hypothetical protein CXB51_014850 [Gossypium anomalum]|uniref:Reverse transcriptase domain-containing protein n=1 Tax=Gossypium anomalum TaxID=47600 RepID=A0A8J6CXY5_9ROSI|nr:hypothetical protein CXB51_014850 [Gossypium anomalum]
MLRKISFLDQWIWKVIRCVASISYSVVLNGEVGNSFLPLRGLHQGDPLSPYLFLVCGEGLSTLLRMAAIRGDLKGFRINRHAPLITHLFFANDSLIFGDAKVHVARVLKEKLEIYAQSLGQVIKFDKSEEIPIYAMSCFLLSLSLCKELEAIMGISLVLWKALSIPKEEGGTGFQDLVKFNIALLAKQWWRLMENPGSLTTRFLRAKYLMGPIS